MSIRELAIKGPDKPTHDSIESILKFMRSKKDAEWISSDNPTKHLVGFTDITDPDDQVHCYIDASLAFNDAEWRSASFRRNLAKSINAKVKFCKDCKHVIPSHVNIINDFICNRPTESPSSYISLVTGEEIKPSKIRLMCVYERSMGGCKDAQFFEPRE